MKPERCLYRVTTLSAKQVAKPAPPSRVGLLLFAIWGVTAVGCGGDEKGGSRPPPPASCGQVAPCGGDLRGQWTAAGSCVDAASYLRTLRSQLGLSCPTGTDAAVRPSTLTRDIWATFVPDGTFTSTSRLSGSLELDVPASCLDGGTCADLNAVFAEMLASDSSVVAAGCSGGATCACSITKDLSSSASGTYTTSGSIVETTDVAGGVISTDYCVSGDELHLVNIDPIDSTVIASDTVLARP